MECCKQQEKDKLNVKKRNKERKINSRFTVCRQCMRKRQELSGAALDSSLGARDLQEI